MHCCSLCMGSEKRSVCSLNSGPTCKKMMFSLNFGACSTLNSCMPFCCVWRCCQFAALYICSPCFFCSCFRLLILPNTEYLGKESSFPILLSNCLPNVLEIVFACVNWGPSSKDAFKIGNLSFSYDV